MKTLFSTLVSRSSRPQASGAALPRAKVQRVWPKIGVTGPDRGGLLAWLFTATGVLLAGGWPVRIRPGKPRGAKGLDGLILGGGADLNPATWQEQGVLDEYLRRSWQHPGLPWWRRIWRLVTEIGYPLLFLLRKWFARKSPSRDEDRDRLEFPLLAQAVQLGLPVLGICRGAQLLNVFYKGSLHEEIEGFYEETPNRSSIFPVKTVELEPGSHLARIMGVERYRVNALHHQAVDEPGDPLRIVAREPNGLAQAIERPHTPLMIGVQWHPEYLLTLKPMRRIFRSLVKAGA